MLPLPAKKSRSEFPRNSRFGWNGNVSLLIPRIIMKLMRSAEVKNALNRVSIPRIMKAPKAISANGSEFKNSFGNQGGM